jgi:hypothetical protein
MAGPLTSDAALMHAPRATIDQLSTALLSRPHGSYSNDDVRFVTRLYWTTCAPLGIDPLLVVSQMRLETGNLESPWSQPPHYNPAGIGVTSSSGTQGVSFPNWAYAVRAHVGRLLAYALHAGSETTLQKEVIAEALSWRPLPDDLRGAAPTLEGLATTWAHDEHYADKISAIANEIAGTLGVTTDDGGDTAGAPRIVTARSLGLTFKNLFGDLGPETNVTGHYSATPRAHTLEEGIAAVREFHADHMSKGWGGIGYHYVIPDDGTLICTRPTILKGAHVLLHNSNNIGVNMPGTTGDKPTAVQAATFKWLLANAHTDALPTAHRTDRDLRRAKRWGHKQWPDNSTSCPGLFLSMYLAGGELQAMPVDEPVAAPPLPEMPRAATRVGNIVVDFENISPEEAKDARDPDKVAPWLPPADPRFDREGVREVSATPSS